MTEQDKKQLGREIAAYERSIRPSYIAKKMVIKFARIIDPNWNKGGDPKVFKKAKKCAEKSVDVIIDYLESVLDVKLSPRHEQDWELIKKYEDVKRSIKYLQL